MAAYFDVLETREPREREKDLFEKLPSFLAESMNKAEGLKAWLGDIDSRTIDSRKALAELPVLRKPELMEMQAANPPFGGLANADALRGNRVFMSPGPVWEPQGFGTDPWQSARGLFAATLIQRNVGPALIAVLAIPVGLAVPDHVERRMSLRRHCEAVVSGKGRGISPS